MFHSPLEPAERGLPTPSAALAWVIGPRSCIHIPPLPWFIGPLGAVIFSEGRSWRLCTTCSLKTGGEVWGGMGHEVEEGLWFRYK